MAEEFRFALVGSGNIASTYAQAVNNLSGITVNSVVSRSRRVPEGLNEKEVTVAEDLTNLTCEFDGVILATPNGMHHADAVKAAELNKHVFTEKVLDISREAMDSMIEACRAHNVKLGVSFQQRMHPDNQIIKQIIDQEKLGRIYAADLYAKFYRGQDYYDSAAYRGNKDLDGGGPFIQQAAHSIDIYCWLFGKPSRIVSMYDTFAHNMEAEDHGISLFKYPHGMIGSITASTVAHPGFPPRLEIHAEKGSVIMENNTISTWAVEGMDNPSQSVEKELHSGATSAAVTETSGHEKLLTDFVQAVREDREPAISAGSARQTTEFILDIYGNSM